jgi:hypothetical protein
MQFDEKQYAAMLTAHRRAKTEPDDLLERYAITLPATGAEVKTQVEAVRAYWNKASMQSAGVSKIAKWCRDRDEELRKQHGDQMESAQWWKQAAAAGQQKTDLVIQQHTDNLRQAYGALGVVTAAVLGKNGALLGLPADQAAQAAARAGLSVIDDKVQLPDAPPIPETMFKSLIEEMKSCQAATIPDLLHPRSGQFTIIGRYQCTNNPNLRLDLAAIKTQITEAEKTQDRVNTARAGALRKLLDAQSKSIDLQDITLYHLMSLVPETSALMAKPVLERVGVESRDAATIAVLLEGRQKAGRVSGLERVLSLLEDGQLREAANVAGNLPDGDEKAEAVQQVAARQQVLDDLLAKAESARRASNEVLAETLLRDAARISQEDAKPLLDQLPPAPPGPVTVTGDGAAVKVFWQRGPGHDESTVYAVARTAGRAPTAPTDGQVHRGSGTECTDQDAPAATEVQYAVFALAEGRPPSRPVVMAVTALPPVWNLKAETGIGTVTLQWESKPEAEVLVTRSAPGAGPVPVPVSGNSAQLKDLPEGIAQRFEVVAVYRGTSGTEQRSLLQQVIATPRGQARPNNTLKVTTVQSAGRIRVHMAWTRIDSSEVHILHTDTPPPWPEGTMIPAAEIPRSALLSGHVEVSGKDCTLEVDLGGGIHYLTALSEGGTGVAVGKPRSAAIIEPVTNLVPTAFADYATLSWQWPPTVQLAEVSWQPEDDDGDHVVLSRAQYQAQGGARVPLGAKPCVVEVRSVITSGGKQYPSPPATVTVSKVVKTPIRYRVSGGTFGRGRKVTFTADQSCTGTMVRMIAAPGRVMPARPADGVTILEATLNLTPGIAAEHKTEIPKTIKRPYWVRCFITSGPGRLVDPPMGDLKED